MKKHRDQEATNAPTTPRAEKGPSVLAHQTDQKKINSRLIIPHYTDVKSTHLFGFIGSVGVFRQFIKGQRILLDAGIILP